MLSFNITTIVCVVVNLLILYLLFRLILYKRVMGVIEKRQEMIQNEITQATDSRQEADQLKAQYEEQIGDAKEESARIVEEAKQRGEAAYRRMMEQAQSEADSMVEQAHAQIRAERRKAREEAQTEIADLAVAAAEKILTEAAGEDADGAMYDAFLKKK